MNTQSDLEAANLLSVRFELILPVEDWLSLNNLAEQTKQTTLSYILDIVKNHIKSNQTQIRDNQ